MHRPQFDISISQRDGTFMVGLRGELDFACTEQVLEALSPLARLDGASTVIIECAELRFIDGSALEALARVASGLGHPPVLRNPPKLLRRVLDITGDGRHFVIDAG